MKANRLIAVISNKKGDCYQIALTKEQENTVLSLIQQLQGGKIVALEQKLSMTIETKKGELE